MPAFVPAHRMTDSPPGNTLPPHRFRAASRRVGLLAGLALVAACTVRPHEPDLGELYNRAASDHHADRNPIILIPGLMGTKLMESASRQLVWGAFNAKALDPKSPEGAQLIALPLAPGAVTSVVPAGVLDRIRARLFGLPIELKAYFHILGTLGIGGYRDEELGLAGEIDYGDDHFTCFQFGYDWRLGNAANAARLHQFILEKKRYVEEENRRRFGSSQEVRFDIVAHSMGGLIARYYLRYGDKPLPDDGSVPVPTWAGAPYVERAFLVAPPNSGAVDAFDRLVNGVKFGPSLPRYQPAIIGTFPAAYELLARSRHGSFVDLAMPDRRLEILDADLWERLGWGLASSEQDSMIEWLLPQVPSADERHRIALDYQRRRLAAARQFHAALDRPASPPAGTGLYLFAGDAEPTDSVMGIDLETGLIEVLEQAPGDGRVPRSSALADERAGGAWTSSLVSPVDWEEVVFLFSDHLGMMKDRAFVDNLLWRLLEEPR